jgi:hypothetical protein
VVGEEKKEVEVVAPGDSRGRFAGGAFMVLGAGAAKVTDGGATGDGEDTLAMAKGNRMREGRCEREGGRHSSHGRGGSRAGQRAIRQLAQRIKVSWRKRRRTEGTAKMVKMVKTGDKTIEVLNDESDDEELWFLATSFTSGSPVYTEVYASLGDPRRGFNDWSAASIAIVHDT